MKSLITEYLDKCLICDMPDVAIHHCMEGTSNRQLSDEDGLIVGLQPKYHNEGGKPEIGERCDVHHCRKMARLMHIIGQLAWEKHYIMERRGLPFDTIEEEAREAFRNRYRKSYL